MTKISPNFSREEFKCKCNKCNRDAVDVELISVLEDVRWYFASPVIITSGNRCPEYNKKVGGAPNSQHMLSKAADIKVKSVDPQEVYDYLDQKHQNKYGIGLYSSWVHIDVRGEKKRWES